MGINLLNCWGCSLYTFFAVQCHLVNCPLCKSVKKTKVLASWIGQKNCQNNITEHESNSVTHLQNGRFDVELHAHVSRSVDFFLPGGDLTKANLFAVQNVE